MLKKKIGIIGIGNIGEAILNGLVDGKLLKPSDIYLSDVDRKKVSSCVRKFGVNGSISNQELVKSCDVIILAVKPHHKDFVLNEIKGEVKGKKLFISVAAGYSIENIKRIIGAGAKVVRVMPNIACRVGQSMSCILPGNSAGKFDVDIAKKIFQQIGKIVVVKNEDQLDLATAVSGSGPAYFYYFTEALADAAKKLGFSEDKAHLLAGQTFIGSAKLLDFTKKDFGVLRQEVTSKGGTTEAALKSFEKDKMSNVVHKAIKTARDRAKQIRKGRY